jgi:hypothetical protein
MAPTQTSGTFTTIIDAAHPKLATSEQTLPEIHNSTDWP